MLVHVHRFRSWRRSTVNAHFGRVSLLHAFDFGNGVAPAVGDTGRSTTEK